MLKPAVFNFNSNLKSKKRALGEAEAARRKLADLEMSFVIRSPFRVKRSSQSQGCERPFKHSDTSSGHFACTTRTNARASPEVVHTLVPYRTSQLVLVF